MIKILQIFSAVSLSVLIVTMFYLVVFKKSAVWIFCQKKANAMTLNFKLSVNFTSQSEEERYVNNFVKKLYEQCLRQNK